MAYIGESNPFYYEGHPKLVAMDNLCTLYGVQRSKQMYGGGFAVYHPLTPSLTYWLDVTETEAEWVEIVKLAAAR